MKVLNFTKAVVFALIPLGIMTKVEAHAGNSSAKVIHACKSSVLGITRIVGINSSCTNIESALHWNIKGEQGVQGLTGATGPQGIKGDTGPKGDTGATGPAGQLPVHVIGELYAGGIIFYVDEDGQHGLIAALANQGSAPWYNGIYKYTGTTGDGFGAGAMNTAMIVATQINDTLVGDFAAKMAADYSVQENGVSNCTGSATETCYGDWYLPSRFELNLLYQKKAVVGGFVGGHYWSSTEKSNNFAWFQSFDDGGQITDPKDTILTVRAIRAF